MVHVVEINKLINLRDYENLTKLDKIVAEEPSKYIPSRMFAWEIFFYKDYLEEVKKYFKNQIVVDLGCGTDLSMYRVCCISESKGYIGVDKEYVPTLAHKLLSNDIWEKHDKELIKISETIKPRLNYERKVPAALAYEDALTFLKRLPDDSVSISASGLDIDVIPNNEKTQEIEKEIERVLHKEGAYISMASRFFHKIPDIYAPQTKLKVDIWDDMHFFTIARK